MDRETMRLRARIMLETRKFFSESGYIEVDTPLLSPDLIPESHLEVFKTDFLHPYADSRQLFLIPSPEVYMKRLLASGSGSIFQICRSFRNVESIGRYHNPEFSMLEYYTVNADYLDSIAVTEKLFSHLLDTAAPDIPEARQMRPPFRRVTMEEAFREFTGIELTACTETAAMREEGLRLGLEIGTEESWEEVFNRIFIDRVEPMLPDDRPLVLMDYPARIPTLAEPVTGKPWYQRWELYMKGVELANCYTEERDPVRVRRFFREEGLLKQSCRVPHPYNSAYPDIFSRFPPCSGVAMGMDRLIMLLSGRTSIEGVIFFPFSDILRETE